MRLRAYSALRPMGTSPRRDQELIHELLYTRSGAKALDAASAIEQGRWQRLKNSSAQYANSIYGAKHQKFSGKVGQFKFLKQRSK